MTMQQTLDRPLKSEDDSSLRKIRVSLAGGNEELLQSVEDRLSAGSIDCSRIDVDDLPEAVKYRDALVVSLDPPQWEGIDQIEEARRAGYTGFIAAVSSSRESAEALRAVKAGADHVLFLPAEGIEFDLLEEKIRMAEGGASSQAGMLKDFFGPVDQGMILLDGAGRFIFANRSAIKILSAGCENDVADVIERNCPDSIFEKARRKSSAITYLDVTLPDKETNKLLGLEICYIDPGTRGRFFLVLLHDFSKWKKLDELRSRFATSLSHRMRTPLTAIRNAVKILSGEKHFPAGIEREKLLDIGWRNVEKLIANLDELQKIFMIESEELNVCRTLIKVKSRIKPLLERLEAEEKIKGFKLGIPEMTLFTGCSRLDDFIVSSIEAYGKWLGEASFIECSSSLKEDFCLNGKIERKLKIYIRPRTSGWMKTVRGSMKDFLSLHEAHRGLVLGRLASALDGELEISSGNTISLVLPIKPSYDREKDLVHPLHMMIERADLMSAEFCLVNLRMVGDPNGKKRFAGLLENCLCQICSDENIVSRDEDSFGYSLFILGKGPDEIAILQQEIDRRFMNACRNCGDEIYPSLRWNVRYSRVPGLDDPSIDSLLPGGLC